MNKLMGGGLALALATFLSAAPQTTSPAPSVNPAGQTAPKHTKKHGHKNKTRAKHGSQSGTNGVNPVNPVTPGK